MSADPREIVARSDRLLADRANFAAQWQEIRDVILPAGTGFVTRESAGVKTHQEVLDNTGEGAHELLAAGLAGLASNKATQWFAVRAEDDKLNQSEEAARALEAITERINTVFTSPRSFFYANLDELYLDYCAYGGGGMFVLDRPAKPILFTTRPLAELAFAESEEGRIDTVYRRFALTARQAVQRWGAAKVGDKVRKAAETPAQMDTAFEFVHAVYPRTDRDPSRYDRGNKAWASCYVGLAETNLVDEGGFDEFPIVAPRWKVRAGEVYGRGRGNMALPDVKMLQRVMRTTIRGAEKQIDPPLAVADDGVLSPVRMTPSGINVVRAELLAAGRSPIQPINTGGEPRLGEELAESIRNRIRRTFLNHLLETLRDPRATATQIVQIAEEMYRVLGPVLDRLEVEMFGPLIERVFAILLRQGALDDLLAPLSGARLTIEYTSPIAKARKLGYARGVAQLADLFAQYRAADTTIDDNLDLDRAYRDSAGLLGLPMDWLRPQRVVQRMRESRQQAAQARAEAEHAATLAGAGANAAKALRLAQAAGAGEGARAA